MCRERLLWAAFALLLAACSKAPLDGTSGFDASIPCEDRDHDGFGRGCARGYDCNDDDPRSTTECRTCSRPERGCDCAPEDGPVSCFLEDKALEGGDVLCSEGTRFCREGKWSGCEDVHQYIAAPSPDTQRVIDPNAGKVACSICDVKCFLVTDNLLADGGVAGGNVTFGPSGGITLLPGDGGVVGGTGDAGSSSLTGCAALAACCSTLQDNLQAACMVEASAGNNTACTNDVPVYCPSGVVSGPVQGCTLGSGADTDCDGIPNVVDSTPGNPLSTTNNQTIFHQLDIGETEGNSINVSFKLRNADVYFLLDMTNTMKEERDNLIASLTTGNVVNCAQLNQCCNRLPAGATKTSCQAEFASYTNQPGKADDQDKCLAAESTYCAGNKPMDCPDNDGNGMPDNYLKTQGVVGATRCLVGSSWFGAGFTRELPISYDPDGCSSGSCSTRYGDRDEQAFKHVIDMTPDYVKVSTALQSMYTDGNWDEPEGGMLALYSVITGKGHYFGINRPSIAPRIAATQCPPDSFGYPCFRKNAVPIVVFFTDRPHHNGPDDATHCNGEGAGCPYSGLSKTAPTTTWTSGAAESSTDKTARFVPPTAETFSSAYNVGDVRGQYVTLVGDTRFMVGDYPTSLIGCGAAPDAPDALIRFRVSTPAGATGTVAPIAINFHLTKDDVYSSSRYGYWDSTRQDDPTPATEFGSVLTVYRGVPNSVSSIIDLGDRKQYAIASGPDSTYLDYKGTTSGTNSGSGYWGGISGCSADGLTNQVAFTFRPTANARIVVDSSASAFPSVVSLHAGLPSSLPKNPNMLDGSSIGIVNTNDTFATANAVPSGATSIDGTYTERSGDTASSSIHADYTTSFSRNITAQRTVSSDTLTNVSSTANLTVGMQLSDSTNWSGTPVKILAISGSNIQLSALWLGSASDPIPVPLIFYDSLVGCGVDPQGRESVFKFNVATPRRVRIDTEGSTFDTVISLHDAPPPTVVTKTDVAGNGTTPGYSIGDVNNASYTLSDVNMGTKALANGYAYAQCGAGPTSNDGVFTFTLSQPTHLALATTSASWDPIVGLFSSKPGATVVLDNSANKNDKLSSPSVVFDIGDVYGNVDTTVKNSDLSSMADDFTSAIVGCGAFSGGRDQVFKFTPLNKTRVRVNASASGSAWNPVIAVFDDQPPSTSAITTTATFDATTVTLPESNCLAYSYHDPAAPSTPAHTYAFCPTTRYADDANNRCVNAGMAYLASINTAAEQSFIFAQTSTLTSVLQPYHIGAIDTGSGYKWRDTTSLSYANWALLNPNGSAPRCADIGTLGTWATGKCSSSGAAASDNTYYVCEDDTPTVAPNEDAATAYAIPALSTRVVTGSTRRMFSDYNGATLLSACGGTISGGDAVFSITTNSSTSYPITIDSAGSSYNVVLGLFENTIDAAGYKGCDAFGGAVLSYTLLPSRTYYIVVKGTASSTEGNYKLKFTNMTTPAPNGTELSCAAGSSSLPKPSVDVDVDANHTYYVVVDQADALFGKYDLEVHSLFLRMSEVDNAASQNETGNSALSLPDPYRSRISVVDTSTAGMSADYGNGATGMCTTSAAAPDAVYKFTPSLSTNVTFTVKPNGAGISNVGIGVYDGLPGTSAISHDLNASGNLNEAASSAASVPFTGPQQVYTGNTSAMTADVDPSLLACGAQPKGHDAVFSFHLNQSTNVEIDSSSSTVTDPVINLYKAGPLSKPAVTTLENDTKFQADANPTPTANVNSALWLYYNADFSHLSAETQSSVSLAAVNDDAPPATKQPQDLGDVAGKRFVISGGDTGPMLADYPGKWSCGSSDSAPDAIYKLFSSTGGQVHIKATPKTGYDAVIGLFDGSNGAPLRLADVSSVVESTACVPSNPPKNLTNNTLKSVNTALGSAGSLAFTCGLSTLYTDDPDGSGAGVDVTLVNPCGNTLKTIVQPQPNGPDLVIVVTNSMQIAAGSTLRILGSRPVAFVVNGTATINGALTVSPDPSGNPSYTGAGGDFGCGSSRGGNAQSSGTASAGGGGGGYLTAGGVGGQGLSGGLLGGAAGAARTTTTLVPLVGGCSGGDSAFGSSGGMAAGALQLSATTSIVLGASGSVTADGANGIVGASGQLGGSGAASGGGISLQSPTITYTASQISARGGTGGGGLGSPASAGGTGSTLAANPGNAGANGGAAAGGGGGGGGYGVVVVATGAFSLAPCTTATNETAASAWALNLDTSGREYVELGNTTGMMADYGGMCSTAAAAPDAVYSFSLTKQTTVRIDARASTSNPTLGLFSAANLGVPPTPTLLENDDRTAADLNPAPTPDVTNRWIAYSGDLMDLSSSGQPQTTIDNSGNANEIIPTELGDPIDRRITVTNANTSAMSADYLAATCSTPTADTARDAIYRFVATKDGPVRVSANYSDTSFKPVIALYRGTHQVMDERVQLQNTAQSFLANLNVDPSTIEVRNLARTKFYSATTDYSVIVKDEKSPVGIVRTGSTTIGNPEIVSIDYKYDSGAPLPISQQQTTMIDLAAAGNKNENADTAAQVPLQTGTAYLYSGDTTAMASDVSESLFTCSTPPVGSPDATFSFSLDKTTTVSVSTEGSASSFATTLALFSAPYTRPSITSLSSPAATLTQLYNVRQIPGAPESSCSFFDYSATRYWLCETARPWGQAEGMCQGVGLHLVTLDNQAESDALLAQIQPFAKDHHIGFTEAVQYTDSWGVWTSGGGGTTGDLVQGRFVRWESGEPNGSGDCLQMLSSGTWDDADCATTKSYICESADATPKTAPSGSTCGSMQTYNGHNYYVCTDAVDWPTASTRCTSAGMALAHVDDISEDTQLRIWIAGSQAWLGGNDSAVEGQWVWTDNSAGFWSVTAFRNWATGEPNQQTVNPGSRMHATDGLWEDTPVASGNFPYVCENPVIPSNQPTPPTQATPQNVDVFSAQRQFRGSTESTPNSVGGFIGCTSNGSAPDAVFAITLKYNTTLAVDITGSFPGSVVGLFKDEFSSLGYANGGSLCGLGSNAGPQVKSLLAPGQYYVVITGTTPTSTGVYNVRFDANTIDPAAFTMKNDDVVAAHNNPIGTVDGKWQVKGSDLNGLTPTIGAVTPIDMGTGTNDNDVNAHSLGSIQAKSVVLTNASTNGLASDYPGGTKCMGAAAVGPDALYTFTVPDNDPLQIRFTTSSWNGQLAIFEGAPVTSAMAPPAAVDLSPGYTNETPASARSTSIGVAQTYKGNLTMMANNVPAAAFNQSFNAGAGSPKVCAADPTGNDAFFTFTLGSTKTVEINSAQSGIAHTIALWDTKPFVAPLATTLQYDDRTTALMPANLLAGADIDDDWVVVKGDTTTLTPYLGLTKKTEGSDYLHDDNVHSLGDVKGKQIVTAGSSTTGLAADYSETQMGCGGADTPPDAAFSFTHSTGGKIRVSLNNPNPVFSGKMALFKGTASTVASLQPTTTNVTATNESEPTAYAATAPGTPVIYAGTNAAMVNNYSGNVFKQGSAYGTRVCTPDAAGKDAFIKFTTPGTKGVSPDVSVELVSKNATFNQTIALWDTTPITSPTAGTMSNDTRSIAFSNPIGPVDDDWVVKGATMNGLMPGALTSTPLTVAANDDPQDLGDPVGKQIKVSGDTTVSTVSSDFPAATLGCTGTNDAPADILYKVRPSKATKIRAAVNNPSAPSVTTSVAIINGTKPQRFVDTTPALGASSKTYCAAAYNYTPSNFVVGSSTGQVNFTSAQNTSLTCGSTLTFNSTTNTWSSFCSQTQPTPVVVSQSGGPDIVVLPFKTLTLGSTTTIVLQGTRPVIFAVESTASISGTINASGSGVTPGAGGNQQCSASTGADGHQYTTWFLLIPTVHSLGAGGGGNGTAGGDSGGGSGNASAGGSARTGLSKTPLLGGCAGGTGLDGGLFCGYSPNEGGAGGGAFQISAGTSVTVSGKIYANGADQTTPCGGTNGGGGAGGSIVLEAPSVVTTGSTITANGGNSSGAGSTSASSPGVTPSSEAGGGGGGYGYIKINQIGACAADNDKPATALSVPIGLTQTYTSPTTSLVSDIAGASWTGCSPDATGPDAFYKFTLTRTTTVEVNATGTGYNHTVGIFNNSLVSQTCADGTSASPAIASKSLPAGTYYVGFKTRNSSVGGTYTVAIRDTLAGGTYSTAFGCATSYVDATLSANTDYYIIVKGATANGTYGLTVTDIGSVTDIGCSADQSAPDAYFDFQVTKANRNYLIALNETGKLDGSFLLMQDVGADNDTTNDTVIGSCATSSATYNNLAIGRYYVIVRGTAVAGGAGILPAEISIQDSSGANALDCADVASGSSGTIAATLPAGTTYYAGITTRGSAGGTYQLQLRDPTVVVTGLGGTPIACADSSLNIDYTIAPADAGKTFTVVVKGTTGTESGGYNMSVTDVSSVQDLCDVTDTLQSDPTAPDAYYAFKVTDSDGGGRSVTVSLDPTSSLDGVYRLFKSDLTAVGSCHDKSAPFTYSALLPGTYYLALRGKSSASGGANKPFQLSVQDQDAYGSMDCSNGLATGGTTITKTLNAGTYYVGIKPQAGQGDPKSYQLMFRDTAVATSLPPLEDACIAQGTTTSFAAVPGKTYYAMVKGNTATDKGAYNLSLTDLNGSAAWGCNDDPTAGDAYFEFNVNDPAGRRVTIDTENSLFDTVLAIFPSGATIGAAGKLACDDNSGASSGSSKITKDLAPGVYYAVVRPAIGATNTDKAFQLSLRDESVYGAIACGATSNGVKANVRATLGPGTYSAVLKGMTSTDKGAYKMRFRDEGPFQNAASEVACDATNRELSWNVTAGKPYYAVVKGADTNQSGPYRLTVENLVARTGMGCGALAGAPDAVYRFHVTNPTTVQIDTVGSQTSAMTPVPTDTVIALYDVSASYFGTNYALNKDNQTVNCDDDSGGNTWSKITADLPGNHDYYVVVKGKTTGWGSTARLPYVLNIRDTKNNQPIACADANSSLLMTQSLPAGDYRLVVSNATGASGAGPYEVHFKNMTAASGGATEVACADTPEEFTSNLVANRPYYLIVKGDAPTATTVDRGQYGLVVETAGTGTTSMGCNASPAAADAFFKFQLASQAWVNIDTDSSSTATTTDTVIALYPGTATSFGTNYAVDVNGAVVGCNDDGGSTAGSSRIRAELSPGTYYVVVKGKTVGWSAATTQFNLSIRDETNTGSIACASNTSGNKKITQTLAAGDYNVVMGTTGATGGAYSLKFRDTAVAAAQSGNRIACVSGGTLTAALEGGKTYYTVVKGDSATDSGGYTMTMEDTVSLAAASGSTSVACATDGTSIDGTYPAGTYYALVTGKNPGDGGPYTLKVRDVDAINDNNRLACDDNSGPNLTSVIERDLNAGTHYVVVKGNGTTAQGSYNLHIRDKNGVPDNELICGGATQAERLTYDVQAGQDYTVLLKGTSTGSSGAYDIKLYDQTGLQAGTGTNLKCLADPQPSPLYNTDWHKKAVDFDLSLTPDTYYVAVKGQRSTDKGTFQLNIGEKTARTSTTYTPPTWTELKDALAASSARVLPVIATGGDVDSKGNPTPYVPAAEAQAKTIALTSHAVRKDGTPIWQKIQDDGRGTGSGLITGIAEMADYLSLDVSLIAVDGPDPGATKFRINVAPGNSPSCVTPHPLVDPVTGICTPKVVTTNCTCDLKPGICDKDTNGNLCSCDKDCTYSCNTQYQCTPGAAPKFTVTFTNPADSPVPANPNDTYGGYHFRLQIIGDKQYLLDEIPVYIIPTTHTAMGPPGAGSGKYQTAGTYMQDITTATCPAIAGGSSVTNDLPQWSDLYFNAALPEGTSLDFQLCTKGKQSDLASCVWSDGTAATRKKVTVRSKGTCASNSQCLGVTGYGNGFCSSGVCQFITQPKVAYDLTCVDNTPCPNGPLGAGDYIISSHCETNRTAFGYGHCVYDSQPVDMGATLLTGEQGLPYARVRVTLHADTSGSVAPTLFQWNMTYNCKSAQ